MKTYNSIFLFTFSYFGETENCFFEYLYSLWYLFKYLYAIGYIEYWVVSQAFLQWLYGTFVRFFTFSPVGNLLVERNIFDGEREGLSPECIRGKCPLHASYLRTIPAALQYSFFFLKIHARAPYVCKFFCPTPVFLSSSI